MAVANGRKRQNPHPGSLVCLRGLAAYEYTVNLPSLSEQCIFQPAGCLVPQSHDEFRRLRGRPWDEGFVVRTCT